MENSKIYLNYLIEIKNDFYNRGLTEQAKKVQKDINKLIESK